MIDDFLVFLLLATILLMAPAADAAITITPTLPGYGAEVYAPSLRPAVQLAKLTGTGTIIVNGKTIPIPGVLAPSSTASAYAKLKYFLNPWLTGAGLLAWSGDAGLTSDGSTWTKYYAPATVAPSGTTVASWWSYVNTGAPYGSCNDRGSPSQSSACTMWGGSYTSFDGKCFMTQIQCSGAGYTGCPAEGVTLSPGSCEATVNVCPAGYSSFESGCTLTDPALAAKTSTAPATQADFEALPVPTIDAYADLAPQLGVPVDAPVYSPVSQSLGPAYAKPDGSTWEPWINVTDAGGGQVMADTFEKQLTTSTGAPVADPVTQDTTETTPTESQCDKYPATLGCATLDTPTAENLGSQTRDISLIAPVTVGGAGSCPAPLTASFLGQSIEFKFDPLCQFANTLRPLILSLAWLGAGFIFVGGVRNG